jgi:hypothetical protein
MKTDTTFLRSTTFVHIDNQCNYTTMLEHEASWWVPKTAEGAEQRTYTMTEYLQTPLGEADFVVNTVTVAVLRMGAI